MIKVGIFNRKGGVGKSTTCINTAGCIDYVHKKKVLIVDCDAQMNVTTCLTLNGEGQIINKTVKDLFDEEKPDWHDYIVQAVINDNRDRPVNTGIYLLPGSENLDSVNSENVFAIKNLLDTVEDQFDYCLIDCPPALTDATISALCAVDFVIIPAQPGRDSVNGYKMVHDEIDLMKANGFNVNIKILGVLLNQVNKRRSLDNYYGNEWNILGKAFASQIRNSAEVPTAYEFGKPLHYYRASCATAEDYAQFTKEMINKIKSINNKGRKK